MKHRTVLGYLQESVSTHPSSDFLIQNKEHITFKQLDEITDKIATSFMRMGLKKGDKIGIIGLNQLEWLYTFFAASKIGVILVTLNVRYRDRELEYMINHSDMKLLITISQLEEFNYVEYMGGFHHRIPSVKDFIYIGTEGEQSFDQLIQTEIDESALNRAKNKVKAEDHLLMLYTSGTTGKPKGVMITNQSILASANAQVEHFGITEKDSTIGALPLNHVGGITCTIIVSLISKSRVFLIPSFHPKPILETIQEKKATIFGGVPTMYLMLLSDINQDEYDLSSIRINVVGGSNVEKSLCLLIKRFFPQSSLVNLFGLSESSGACILSRLTDDLSTVQKSIGVPIGDFEVKVVSNDHEEVPYDQIGELLIKGDCVADGYYKNPDETSNSFQGEWLHTGDMVSQNEQGYISYKGRKKEMYISGGFNISPTEIEDLLTTHHKVQMAAGIGVPDELMGEVGVYYIVPKKGEQITSSELLDFCKRNLADYKIPKEFIFVDDVPMTPAGKIQKAALKKQYFETIHQ